MNDLASVAVALFGGYLAISAMVLIIIAAAMYIDDGEGVIDQDESWEGSVTDWACMLFAMALFSLEWPKTFYNLAIKRQEDQ